MKKSVAILVIFACAVAALALWRASADNSEHQAELQARAAMYAGANLTRLANQAPRPLEAEAQERSRRIAAQQAGLGSAAIRSMVRQDPRINLKSDELDALTALIEISLFALDSGDNSAYRAYYAAQGFELPSDWLDPVSMYAFRTAQVGFVSDASSALRPELVVLRIAGIEMHEELEFDPDQQRTTVEIGEGGLRGPTDMFDPVAERAHMVEVRLPDTSVKFPRSSHQVRGTTSIFFVKRPNEGNWMLWRFRQTFPRGNGSTGGVRI